MLTKMTMHKYIDSPYNTWYKYTKMCPNGYSEAMLKGAASTLYTAHHPQLVELVALQLHPCRSMYAQAS